jgi:transglutaminase-like putative cysteine protease
MKRTARLICAIAVLTVGLLIFSPKPAPAGDEWQPISPEDLALKDNPASPGAHAMILYREDVINAKAAWDDEYMRIKIFTQEGVKDLADVSIPFNPAQGRIQNVRARTIQPDGRVENFDGKVFEKTIVKASGVKFLAKTFSLPDVKPGSIIEYKYRTQRDPMYVWGIGWTVQEDYYTRLGRFSIIPDADFGVPPLYYRVYGLANQSPKRQPDGSLLLEVRDTKGLDIEDYMPPDRALRARVSFFYKDISAPTNETTDQFWKRTGKQWAELVDNFVNKKGALQAEAGRVTTPSDAPEVKVQKIFARVREIRNLSYEDEKSKKEEHEEKIKKNVNAEDVLKHGYGSARDINFLFVGLCRAAGFPANEVYVASRSETVFSPELQDTHQLEADVVWVRAGDKDLYLDPASKFIPYGMLPWVETSTSGLKVSKDGSEVVSTPIPESGDATWVRHAGLDLNEEGAAVGKIEVDYTGHFAASWRQDERNDDEAGRKKEFSQAILAWLPSGSTFEVTSISNWDKIAEPVRVEGTVKIPSLGSAIGHRMLVPATVFHEAYSTAFVTTKRVNIVYFHVPFEETDTLTFRAPAGFKIETVPGEKKINPGAVSYEISGTQTAGAAEVKRHLRVNAIIVPTEHYPALRAFFAGVKTNDDAQIVLRNAESASK